MKVRPSEQNCDRPEPPEMHTVGISLAVSSLDFLVFCKALASASASLKYLLHDPSHVYFFSWLPLSLDIVDNNASEAANAAIRAVGTPNDAVPEIAPIASSTA